MMPSCHHLHHRSPHQPTPPASISSLITRSHAHPYPGMVTEYFAAYRRAIELRVAVQQVEVLARPLVQVDLHLGGLALEVVQQHHDAVLPQALIAQDPDGSCSIGRHWPLPISGVAARAFASPRKHSSIEFGSPI